MTRKLVTVRAIKELVEIKGADRIELAIVDGWQVVVKKGIHSVGELILYYEIDSFLPAEDHRYAFLDAPEASGKGFIQWGEKRGARLKTIKLRKQLSQGLVLPLADFPEVLDAMADMHAGEYPDGFTGMDVTELLKVEKWEPIEKDFRGNTPGSSDGKRFPAFIRKTDQERIQNYGTLVERALDEEFEVTVKKDGSSLTVFRVDPKSPYYADAKKLTGKRMNLLQKLVRFFLNTFERKQPVYGICSRNVLLPLTGDSNFHKAVEANDLLFTLDRIGGSYALQGELVAPDIQGNYEKVDGVEFHLFDMFDIDKQEYVLPYGRQGFAGYEGVKHATVVAQGKLRDIIGFKEGDDIVKKCLEYAEGPGDNKGVMREGVVFKATRRDFSFKAVSNSYLLATGKMKLKSALAGFLLAFTFVAWAPQLPPPDARQTACTAMAVKREAGGESLRGQRAVLDVLYARMYKHNLLPCQVIAQPGQFSFYQGRVVASKEDLQRLHRLATMRPVVAEATYFHTVDVSPEWAEKFQRLAVIGHHVFYKEKR